MNSWLSSNGAPGPDYWQNRADYALHAQLDTVARALKTTETITCTNNSPGTYPVFVCNGNRIPLGKIPGQGALRPRSREKSSAHRSGAEFVRRDENIRADGDEPAVADLHLTMKFHQPLRLPTDIWAKDPRLSTTIVGSGPWNSDNFWCLPL